MVLAIVLGIVVGVVGFLPLVGALHVTRLTNAGNNLISMTTLMLGLAVSLMVLVIPLAIVLFNMRDLAIPFVLAEAIALVVTAIVYGVYKLVRK